MASDRQSPTPSEQVARLYEQAESQAAKAGERLVGSQGFASLLGQVAENTAALTKLGYDAMDLVIRNLRVAGRRDVVRLARQLGRTEDKLERVLQELEELRDQIGEHEDGTGSGTAREPARRRARNGGRAASAGDAVGASGGAAGVQDAGAADDPGHGDAPSTASGDDTADEERQGPS